MYSCKKDKINPYDDPNLNPPQEDTTSYFTNATDFSALYNDVFMPYCANSGCHDGSFEPDFRSIESSYNTMLYQPVIKNTSSNTYTYRVLPYNSEESILYARLTLDIDSVSGIMPLSAAYNPEHEWHDVKATHIESVKSWIDGGAKDVFGDSPLPPNNKPEMQGVVAYITGQNTALSRDGERGTILVPAGANSLDIWFSVIDDNLSPTSLTYNKVKFSENLFNFHSKPELDLTVVNSPLIYNGYYVSQMVEYYHKITYDISSLSSGDERFIKIFVQDDVNDITEIPNNGSSYQIIRHFTFQVL